VYVRVYVTAARTRAYARERSSRCATRANGTRGHALGEACYSLFIDVASRMPAEHPPSAVGDRATIRHEGQRQFAASCLSEAVRGSDTCARSCARHRSGSVTDRGATPVHRRRTTDRAIRKRDSRCPSDFQQRATGTRVPRYVTRSRRFCFLHGFLNGSIHAALRNRPTDRFLSNHATRNPIESSSS
jgi:hypothetical protein